MKIARAAVSIVKVPQESAYVAAGGEGGS